MGRRLLRLGLVACVLAGALLLYVFVPPARRAVTFPDGKRFAFTIVDDTDQATFERTVPVYDLLHRFGLRTTKTVWVLPPRDEETVSTNRGDTLRDPDYERYVVDLVQRGFEIALHGVRGGTSARADTLAGLDEFKAKLGRYPSMQVNHAVNLENIYWGPHRWSIPLFRWGFSTLRPLNFFGEDPSSPYFWGDVAKERIKYVRRFTLQDLNALKVNPSVPYRLDHTPYVNYWYETSDGGSIDAFDELLQPENLDALEREGGVAFVYAHLGAGSFNKGSGVDPRFEARIRDVAARNGWFAPASEILDHLSRQPGWNPDLTFRERLRLETLSALTVLFRD